MSREQWGHGYRTALEESGRSLTDALFIMHNEEDFMSYAGFVKTALAGGNLIIEFFDPLVGPPYISGTEVKPESFLLDAAIFYDASKFAAQYNVETKKLRVKYGI